MASDYITFDIETKLHTNWLFLMIVRIFGKKRTSSDMDITLTIYEFRGIFYLVKVVRR